MRAEISQELEEEVLSFLIEIQKAIMNQCAVAASGISIEDNLLSIHWVIISLGNSTRIEGGVESKNWKDSMIPAGESIGTLDLVWYIIRRCKHIESREVVIYSNNKMNLKNINRKVCRESEVT